MKEEASSVGHESTYVLSLEVEEFGSILVAEEEMNGVLVHLDQTMPFSKEQVVGKNTPEKDCLDWKRDALE